MVAFFGSKTDSCLYGSSTSAEMFQEFNLSDSSRKWEFFSMRMFSY